MEWIPHRYQEEALDYILDRNYAGIFIDPGLGKTSISLAAINTWKVRALVVAPIRVIYGVWPREIDKWDNFRNIKYTILHGENKEANFLKKGAGVYLINPEGLPWLEKMIKKHKRFPWKVVFIDESSKFKGHNAKRTKFIFKIASLFQKRYILTGNPRPNSYLDLWSQIRFLDDGEALGSNFYGFRHKYFWATDFRRWNWEIKPGCEEEIKNRIASFCMHLNATDHIDMPDLIYNDIPFDLPAPILKQYKSMERKKTCTFNGMEFVADSAGVAANKCAQICNGVIYESLTEEERLKKIKPRSWQIHNKKLEILEDLVAELNGSPLMVCYRYREELRALRSVFKNAPFIGGGSKSSETTRIVDEWNQDKHPVLLIHPASGGHGLNLQEGSCTNVFIYGGTYNFDDHDQLVRRVWRQGNINDRVVVHRPLANPENRSADWDIKNSVDNKNSDQRVFLDAFKLRIESEF